MRRHLLGAGASIAVCMAIGVVVALALGLPANDAITLVSVATAASSAVALCTVIPFRPSSRRTMQAQTMLMAAAVILTALAGVVAAAVAMFISSHDFRALMVVLVVAAGASTGVALQLSWRFGRDADIVAALTGHLANAGADNAEVGAADPAVDIERLSIDEMHDLAVRLRSATERLAESRRHERALERSRRELVAWISHDLRSPLASIRALAEALEDDIVTEPHDRLAYYGSIRREAERLGALVDDLFELSRVQAGNVSTDPSRIPVHELVSDVLGGVGHAAEQRGVSLKVDTDRVGADLVPAADLLRVLRNLLDNAVRHTPEGGTVRLEAMSTRGGVVLRVIDECGGIPERDLARVFDVAFRGDAARQRDSGGGGLGLAIAKGLVEAHAGEIDVCNHAGGCRFEVRMPTGVARSVTSEPLVAGPGRVAS
jgi:signal transduction histidine kinase